MNSRIIAAVVGVLTSLAVVPAANASPALRAACAEPAPGSVRCLAMYGAAAGLQDEVYGLGADDLAAAYNLPPTPGADTTIAISIAYDAPNLEADLNQYRQEFGLPECTTANGCFRKVNQRGDATPLPAANFGWAIESTLDVSMVSAACPVVQDPCGRRRQPRLRGLGADSGHCGPAWREGRVEQLRRKGKRSGAVLCA
ncbi:hypothetical protein LWC34_50235 [Kibdelosporangium philippinense]|uniref:Peptidase inhibitor family I36 n=1 Tax=Kibdelosporangium philippinense TaxID=211113 RepID=A0ABS8ZY30_9PSEU|nr:hypothetical protein [Kibdelosporangium philippinense]MCE7010932.1 hypothetical protein [Kibdelosporangium philippinense]